MLLREQEEAEDGGWDKSQVRYVWERARKVSADPLHAVFSACRMPKDGI
jgi:hypothetical protein